jgi:hypothetical protein
LLTANLLGEHHLTKIKRDGSVTISLGCGDVAG